MKQFRTIDEQIALLKYRGLVIKDTQMAQEMLLRHNYYKIIRDYNEIFTLPNSRPRVYKDHSTFEQVLEVFLLDRAMRIHFFDQIIIIENELKSLMSYEFSKAYGPYEYLKLSNYDLGDDNPKLSKEQRWKYQNNVRSLITKFHQEILRNHNKPYLKEVLCEEGAAPLWVFIGVLTMGTLGKFYDNMKLREQKAVANYLGVTPGELVSFMQLLTAARNICAHNEQLYSMNTEKLEIPKERYIKALNYNHARNNLFSVMICFKHLLSKADFTHFFYQVDDLILNTADTLTSSQHLLLLKQMGFPPNWRDLIDL